MSLVKKVVTQRMCALPAGVGRAHTLSQLQAPIYSELQHLTTYILLWFCRATLRGHLCIRSCYYNCKSLDFTSSRSSSVGQLMFFHYIGHLNRPYERNPRNSCIIK